MYIAITPNNGWKSTDSIAWKENGFKVKSITRYDAFARVHLVSYDPKTNIWTGVADPDWEGTAERSNPSYCEF